MVWLYAIIAVIGIIFVKVFLSFWRARKSMLKTQVDAYGGMAKKYHAITNYYEMFCPTTHVKTNDMTYVINTTNEHLAIGIRITENFNESNVTLQYQLLENLGKETAHEEDVSFPSSATPDKMLLEIERFFTSEIIRLKAQSFGITRYR